MVYYGDYTSKTHETNRRLVGWQIDATTTWKAFILPRISVRFRMEIRGKSWPVSFIWLFDGSKRYGSLEGFAAINTTATGVVRVGHIARRSRLRPVSLDQISCLQGLFTPRRIKLAANSSCEYVRSAKATWWYFYAMGWQEWGSGGPCRQLGPGAILLVGVWGKDPLSEADDTFCGNMLFFTVLRMTVVFAFIA